MAEEAGVGSLNSASGLFRLLVVALLMSARIRWSVALAATKALFDHGWTTADAGWSERTRVLNRSGYARDTCDHLLDRFGGDLGGLREQSAGKLLLCRPAASGRLGPPGQFLSCRLQDLATRSHSSGSPPRRRGPVSWCGRSG
jgi:hypothetical protein